ncbi:hypothetical protein [Paenibacillus medicaginis]|uniref:Uncharacterized protein n=1 Tax=Paenibacillus medicaginis TaxID=1470560 RepID=A0ABV5BV35_9BACL
MKRLGNMSKKKLEEYIDNGHYCEQDIIDLYDDFVSAQEEIENLKREIERHRSNYDSDYWNEKEQEMREDGVWD